MNAEYSWNFGTDKEVGTGKMVSSSITYKTTGSQTASVIVTNGLESRKYDCSPLQVNRLDRAICICTASGGDLQKGTTVTWTANCVGSSNSTYVWNGMATDANTFTKSITVADVGEKLTAPTLTVQTADGSVFEGYTCDDIKVTDGPEYELVVQGNQLPLDRIELTEDACIIVSGSWTNEYYRPLLQLACDLQGPDATLRVSYASRYTIVSGLSYGIDNFRMDLGPVSENILYEDICVSFTKGSVVMCGLMGR